VLPEIHHCLPVQSAFHERDAETANERGHCAVIPLPKMVRSFPDGTTLPVLSVLPLQPFQPFLPL
jgi:hypothetical protein